MIKNKFTINLLPLLAALTLTGCGNDGDNSDGAETPPLPLSPINAIELLDPTPGAGDAFGQDVIILSNGNIVVTDPFDSSVAANNGAVHLYNSRTQTLISSIYGSTAGGLLGANSSITALGNSNFVIASPNNDEGGIVDSGSVRLMDGETGEQIGVTLVGNVENDRFGAGGITVLGNNNFVIASPISSGGRIVDAGSVSLVNGVTGEQIGSTLKSDGEGDVFGSSSVTALGNSNFVIMLPSYNGNISNLGSVKLVNGVTGEQIGATLAGEGGADFAGSSYISAVGDNNFVIVLPSNREAGIFSAGSVRLVNGVTGEQIGVALAGDSINDQLGSGGITVLENNNFVIVSPNDNESSIGGAGSVRLVNGETGVQISNLTGNSLNDRLGSRGIIALGNNNFVIVSSDDDEGGVVDAGSVKLVNGETGVQIGETFAGDIEDDQLGAGLGVVGVIALANNNFVIASPFDDEAGLADVGSVTLVNGTTGEQIGATLTGNSESDQLGLGFGIPGVVALGNNNFVVASPFDSEGGIVGSGSVRLVNGVTGEQIGATLAGETELDLLGNSGITALKNNDFVIVSSRDDEGGIVDAGSVRLVNGATGVQIGVILAGSVTSDTFRSKVIGSASGDFYILSLSEADNNGLIDSGSVRLIEQ